MNSFIYHFKNGFEYENKFHKLWEAFFTIRYLLRNQESIIVTKANQKCIQIQSTIEKVDNKECCFVKCYEYSEDCFKQSLISLRQKGIKTSYLFFNEDHSSDFNIVLLTFQDFYTLFNEMQSRHFGPKAY